MRISRARLADHWPDRRFMRVSCWQIVRSNHVRARFAFDWTIDVHKPTRSARCCDSNGFATANYMGELWSWEHLLNRSAVTRTNYSLSTSLNPAIGNTRSTSRKLQMNVVTYVATWRETKSKNNGYLRADRKFSQIMNIRVSRRCWWIDPTEKLLAGNKINTEHVATECLRLTSIRTLSYSETLVLRDIDATVISTRRQNGSLESIGLVNYFHARSRDELLPPGELNGRFALDRISLRKYLTRYRNGCREHSNVGNYEKCFRYLRWHS